MTGVQTDRSSQSVFGNILAWIDKNEWPFGAQDLPATIPHFTSTNPWEFMLLVVYLPDYGNDLPDINYSVQEWWKIAGRRQVHFANKPDEQAWWHWPNFILDGDHLELRGGASYRPGIRWVRLNLASGWRSKSAEDIRAIEYPKDEDGWPAHVEVLAWLAQNPHLAQKLNGTNGPKLWLPGLKATISQFGALVEATPILHYSNGRLCFDAYCKSRESSDPGYAEPTVHEL